MFKLIHAVKKLKKKFHLILFRIRITLYCYCILLLYFVTVCEEFFEYCYCILLLYAKNSLNTVTMTLMRENTVTLMNDS